MLAVAVPATGVAWISILSALQVAAQMTLPERVSVADREIQQRAKQYMVANTTTRSQHWLADRETCFPGAEITPTGDKR